MTLRKMRFGLVSPDGRGYMSPWVWLLTIDGEPSWDQDQAIRYGLAIHGEGLNEKW